MNLSVMVPMIPIYGRLRRDGRRQTTLRVDPASSQHDDAFAGLASTPPERGFGDAIMARFF
jgi:hypothetical protein